MPNTVQTPVKPQIKVLRYTEPAANEFDSFLRDKLSFNEYTQLHTHLGGTGYRATSIKNDPAIIETEEVAAIATLTGESMETVWDKIKKSAK